MKRTRKCRKVFTFGKNRKRIDCHLIGSIALLIFLYFSFSITGRSSSIRERRRVRFIISVPRNSSEVESVWNDIYPGIEFHRSLANETYPPYEQSLRLWKYLQRDLRSSWFVRCDSDTFFNKQNIIDYLSLLDSKRPYYMGRVSMAYEWERAELRIGRYGFDGYVLGGNCEILSNPALEMVDFEKCRSITEKSASDDSSFIKHSDVELGRCLWHYKIRPVNIRENMLCVEERYHSETRKRGPRMCHLQKLRERGKLLTAHPVKDLSVLSYLAKHISVDYRRLNCSCSVFPQSSSFRTSCYQGFNAQDDPCALKLPRCEPENSDSAFPEIDAIFVVGVQPEKRLHKIPRFLLSDKTKLIPEKISYSTYAGDMQMFGNYDKIHRTALKQVLESSLRNNFENIIITSEKIREDWKSGEMWEKIKSGNNCYTQAINNGGSLILGHETNLDVQNPELNTVEQECENSGSINVQATTTVISLESQKAMLNWLNATDPFKKLEYLWSDLVELGYEVRSLKNSMFNTALS